MVYLPVVFLRTIAPAGIYVWPVQGKPDTGVNLY